MSAIKRAFRFKSRHSLRAKVVRLSKYAYVNFLEKPDPRVKQHVKHTSMKSRSHSCQRCLGAKSLSDGLGNLLEMYMKDSLQGLAGTVPCGGENP